ncbi:helix-turn-helix domain-containing protein [Turicibacter sanguinis]|uniref:helix-turn-helix domain-containing protein n=1 Tax=Turicibacter sanguinis TaxID=154288 RepID=UPI0012BB4EC9|nr:helix-turn-helix transcriptional regulator [Turicibacter sanguinis]MCU7201573.1 helix-turn-helix domain-containing protein [Turicibacter sanguinis]MTN45525.1 helix-turn-helix domain-containing protein [Turicibacter sanguinis]MTN51344.1 helix-turn-helix domain-containing protein [Turicibacter sanguinis]MTN54454.1 helix-turn-helix domain-containing protein [Turicibacter sanguinis]MTN57587.1 helix-turn-helix domain-containing protein [Turicibacter sanguinis]
MYEIFDNLLKEKNITAYRVAKETGIATATLSDWKNGRSTPKQDKLQKIADYFEVSLDYLIGNTNIRHIAKENKNNTVLTKKDERDIQKKLDSILKDLDNSEDTLMYDGEPMDDLTKELVKDSLEHIIRLAKISAKEKYTPKKYRK